MNRGSSELTQVKQKKKMSLRKDVPIFVSAFIADFTLNNLVSGTSLPSLCSLYLFLRHRQGAASKAFQHVKVDTLSQPEAVSSVIVPGEPLGKQPALESAGGLAPHLPMMLFVIQSFTFPR